MTDNTTNQQPSVEGGTAISYEDVIKALPAGYSPIGGLVQAFSDTLPPGAPEQANALMRRVFVAGGMAVMGQIHKAFMSECTKAGDSSEVVAVVNAMGVGLEIARDVCELEAAALADRTTKSGIVIPIHAGQVN